MPKLNFDVAIVGGSFAGLAVARGLAQAFGPDIRLAIIDRAVPATEHADDSRGFAIWAGAQKVLESLGAWDGIRDAAETVTAIEISDSRLDDAFRPALVTYDARTDDGSPAAYIVPASVLATALYRSVADDPAVTWFAPAEIESAQWGETASELTLRDGTVVSAALTIAADGRQSKLREAVGIKTIGWPYAQTGIVARVKFSEPHGGVAIQHFLPGGPFAILPLPGNRACITWSADKDEAARMIALDDDSFLAELDRRIGGRFGTISLDGPRQSWPLDLRLPRRLIAPRFALVGDAAHGVHPVAGQGVNLALRDAAAMIEILVDAGRIGLDFGSGTHLERYQRWRRFDSAMSATLYDGINRAFAIDSMVLRAGRGAALGVLDRIPSLKELIIAEAAGVTGDLPKLARGVAV
ncbi:FAD-dependent monooxygenase [Hyphomicrobium sp. 802]|uniref:FAD-dependent monooxygenase n=1 Tax=Hyphomicrobium sp. 802 TaxID=1112272 RepID=UPI00045E81C3|nr:FAD-dependent monooxygenase [Hyphomicrobium sp. 802]